MELDVESRARYTAHGTRTLVIAALGPLTALGGIVWAAAQPYRLTVLDPSAHGPWDHLAQGPLLVVLAALAFELIVGQPLRRDLEAGDDASH